MPALKIRRVDPHDEPSLRQWWETGHAAGAERPYDLHPLWVLSRVALPRDDPEFEVALLGAFDNAALVDSMVGIAQLRLPLHDNQHMAYADILVPPVHRRRGVGSQLLEATENYARAAGRKVMLVEAPAPLAGENAGTRFAAAMGYQVGSSEEIKVLDLAAATPRWDALRSEVDEGIGAYRIVEWRVETPQEHVQRFCDLQSVFTSQIPLGDLPLESSEWTPARLRAQEQRSRALGRDVFVAVAFATDGALVGASDVRVVEADPRTAEIGITIVLPEHRGHRLGLALKLATHRRLRAAYPACEIVVTSNAGVNQHMNAVNERLGYQAVERLLEMQKEL